MEEQGTQNAKTAAEEWANNFSQLAGKSQSLFKKILEKRIPPTTVFQMIYFNQIYQKFLQQLSTKPENLIASQASYWQQLFIIWQRFMMDKQENAIFSFIKDYYLFHVDYLQGLLKKTEGLDEKKIQQLRLYLKQLSEAFSPENFVITNPTIWQATIETKGKNLLKGLDNALSDLNKKSEFFQIQMTDTSGYEVGKNIALTAGKIIFQNELMQLIHYEPQVQKTFQRPLLFIPPWINKYYILDLNPALSVVDWLLKKGYSVFMISWVNPDDRQAGKDFAAYMSEGPLKALDLIEKATGEKEINALGYCVGGTLLGCTLAYLAARHEKRIHSATYLCALLDFKEPGELGAFIDEEQLQWLEEEIQHKGYYGGEQMATTFNLLRPKDLIWSYYVKNYLLGETPLPHDILYWNGDSTNIPGKMHLFYLRNMYLNNLLTVPGGIKLKGIPIDLKRVEVPAFFISTLQDHIAPWKSVYAGTALHSGPFQFILGGSGHIAGAINPPGKNKYNYYTNAKSALDAETWFKDAKEQPGSWWPYWEKWLAEQSGKKVKAPMPGEGGLRIIEDAPGSYVRVQLKDLSKREKELV